MLKAETIRKLEERQQELADLYLEESGNLASWRDLSTKDRRGDVYWLKKNCRATLGLVVITQSVLDRALTPAAPPPGTPTPGEDETELEREVALTTKEADALIAKVRGRGKAAR